MVGRGGGSGVVGVVGCPEYAENRGGSAGRLTVLVEVRGGALGTGFAGTRCAWKEISAPRTGKSRGVVGISPYDEMSISPGDEMSISPGDGKATSPCEEMATSPCGGVAISPYCGEENGVADAGLSPVSLCSWSGGQSGPLVVVAPLSPSPSP